MSLAPAEASSLFKMVLNTLDAASLALTVCDVAAEVQVIAPLVDNVASLLVIDGTMHLLHDCHRQIVRAGEMVMIPARKQVSIAASKQPKGMALDSRDHLVKHGSWLVSDATLGRKRVLRVAMVKIAGTKAEWLTSPHQVSLVAGESDARLFGLLCEQFDRTEAGAPALALSLVSACIVQALKTSIGADQDAPITNTETRSPSLARALSALRANPGQQHTTDTLAMAAGMSRSTFIRQLARFTHASPMEYVQRVRLEEAAIMLRSTTEPIKTIAAATGFRSRSHFSRAFRASFGTDPSAYRRDSTRRFEGERDERA
jgi:AraC-like DNA-binding protein